MGASENAARAAEHHEDLFRWALALAAWDREEAMEIVQQTYLEVAEGRADLSKADHSGRFLFGVARRVAASRRRRRSVWARIFRGKLLPARELDVTSLSPEDEISRLREKLRLEWAVRELPVRQREVLSLVFVQGLTVEEAARVMEVSVGSARTHYHRAKLRVARLLEDADER